ncbi:hypothetical protein [Flavobacterium gelatinilyticum]|uniref:hypothetical protein n=1 Tax=Flavobacterium gelatinilyticum TaxID=3003260 RepID=UPI002480C72D|nr:hypothetical protein [Flavobacterium gelatinilyticum]
MKKTLFIAILSSILFTKCISKDYYYKESLTNNFYLMQSDVLPSKYICIRDENSELILLDDIIEVIGNDTDILIKTKDDKNQLSYHLIKAQRAKYQEDIISISYTEFEKKKKSIQYEYTYDESNGIERYFRWKKS